MKETEKKVVELLEHYGEKKRQLKQLRYEMTNPQLVSSDEMIEAMALPGSVGGAPSSHQVSDRTMFIALNYQGKTAAVNQGAADGIYETLLALGQEIDRLEHYVALLEPRKALVIQKFYFEKKSWSDIRTELELSPRSAQNLRRESIAELAKMYDLAKDLDSKRFSASL